MNLHDWPLWLMPVLAAWLMILCGSCSPANSPAPRPARKDTPGGKAATLPLYVGTYTKTRSKGIYRLELDLATGALTAPQLAAEATNPSFLAAHPAGRFLYSVTEVGEFAGLKSGAVSAFAIDRESGKLTLLNQQSSGGAGPCHLIVDGPGKHVLVANYSSGSLCVLPVEPDGRLAEPSQIVQHHGAGPTKYQKGPHAHSIHLDAAGRFAFAADLGMDKVLIYRFDPANGKLTPNDPPAVSLAPGAGPRHFAFHPTGRFAYVINELGSTVTALAYDPARGTLSELETLSTLPARFTEENATAEVAVHPTGRFLYGSNRGHDSIAIFAIDPASGRLTLIGHQPTGGKTPRHFAIDPTGRWLLAANQDSDSLVVLGIDAKTGLLHPTAVKAEVPSPVCVMFLGR